MLWSNSSDSFRSCRRYVESIFTVKDQALTVRWDLRVVPERRQRSTNQQRLTSQKSEDLNCTTMEGQNLATRIQVCRVWRCVAEWVVPEISRKFLRNGNHSFTHLQPPEDLNAKLHRCKNWNLAQCAKNEDYRLLCHLADKYLRFENEGKKTPCCLHLRRIRNVGTRSLSLYCNWKGKAHTGLLQSKGFNPADVECRCPTTEVCVCDLTFSRSGLWR
jgi:hypothetical protein